MKKKTLLLFFFLFLLFSKENFAITTPTIKDSSTISNDSISTEKIKKKRILFNRQKITAAILAFPLPLGFLGAHRIYLGTKPYVPFVYAGTLGGCIGILPFIDFCVIVLADETMMKSYQNNPKIFMWIK